MSSFSVPSWPLGGGFANGSIDLGGLEVRRVSSFAKVWSAGGGATFLLPSPIPAGFHSLGSVALATADTTFARALVVRSVSDEGGDVLAAPTDFTLLWSASDGSGHFWLPVAPSGYHAVGYVVTPSADKPSLESLRCVREDLTEQCEESKSELWSTTVPRPITVRSLVPSVRGPRAAGLPPGTFVVRTSSSGGPSVVRCLKNKGANLAAAMPNLAQINAAVKAYSPLIYFHPDESYLPSSVRWFFDNGALLYSKNDQTSPTRIDSSGRNLPLGGDNDGAYWLDLPADEKERERVKKGDLASSTAYVHVKPVLGGTATDLVFWIFYPFNGPSRAKLRFLNLGLGKIGEHIGDWEHVTVRMSNFDGEMIEMYFSEHSSGTWMVVSEMEFEEGKPVAYASLNGHAFYSKEGLVLQGSDELGIGIRNDAAKGKARMDAGGKYEVVAAEYLQAGEVEEPAWLEYRREWGPKVEYKVDKELQKLERLLPKNLVKALRKLVDRLPAEVLGEEGPTGPKLKSSWDGDEP